MAPMERYTVNVAPPGAGSFLLLIPFTPTSTVSSLSAEVKRRASAHDDWPEESDVTLRVGGASGPILYEFDILANVIVDPKVEIITATSRVNKRTDASPPSGEVQGSHQLLGSSKAGGIKIRVITPVLARSHRDTRSIPILRNTITNNTTLRELQAHISNHLCFPVSGPVQQSQECNCSFARQIDDRALIKDSRAGDSGNILSTQDKVIIVHNNNKVQVMNTAVVDKDSLTAAVIQELGGNVEAKEISFIGGTLAPNSSERYSKMPVIAICSKQRHGKLKDDSPTIRRRDQASNGIDLHTSEAPIVLSTLNMDLTLDNLYLTDCVIDGVLNIYVVERRLSNGSAEKETGKDAIFLDGDAWTNPVFQSNRGVSMLLSSLRVFTERTGAKHMDLSAQDAVLHVFNLLTRFPPAVRAVHILMNGKSPGPRERAALAQALYEVLKDVVPIQLIRSDAGRYFEGTRLLFGLILEKAKHLKLTDLETTLPYISSLKVLDLRNTFTMEPVVNPVQTTFGIVENGYYEAFKEGGTLYWKTGEQPLSALPLDERTKRIALLCGGVVSQITVFDLNFLSSTSGYTEKGGLNFVMPLRELSDLNHLSALCSRNNLSVLPPAALPSAEAPALTLDRAGLLAVYVGRAPCAQPGQDISIFRPTSGGEETVDVSIITQLLVPIIKERDSDGTAIFDAFGDGIRRKFKDPDEIVMVCVDCSNSMSEASDFAEIKDETDDEGSYSEDLSDDGLQIPVTGSADGSTFLCATLDEMKASITEHESFSDMVAIVQETPEFRRREVAAKVLEILSGLSSQELSTRLSELENYKLHVTVGYYRNLVRSHESDITKLKTFIAGLNSHKLAICDFLIYRAANSSMLDKDWTWNAGDEIPKISKNSSEISSNPLPEEELSIPPDYLCPISRDVMDDPVLTCDGFTFDRNAIERWFQIRMSSPLTGLVLDNADLRFNGELSNQIKRWIDGSDIIEAASTPENLSASLPRTRSASQPNVTVRFFSRLGSFNRKVPKALSVSSLYRVAFRGMKGRHPKFQLQSRNVFLTPSESPLSTTNIQNNSIIHINVPEDSPSANPSKSSSNSPGTENAEFEELCLIKVYERCEQMLFSYWTPKKTTNTFTSVIFKYWRHKSKGGAWWFYRDMSAWTHMTDSGDSHISGRLHDHWTPLSAYLSAHHASGTIQDEKVFIDVAPEASWDTSSEDSDMDANTAAAPLVLKVYMGMKAPKDSGKNLSRLDVLKSMFDAFVNRLLAYNFQIHMGLVTFQSSASISQGITHAIENFRHKVNKMTAQGDTALWDALALANDQLAEHGRKFPNAKKRIICLSDGNDTKSTQRCGDVSRRLMENNVVVDSFCLGNEDNVDLRTISYLSGGYKFKPESLEQAMAICEMEPVLTQLERPDIVAPREAHSHLYDSNLRLAFARDKAVPEIVTKDVFPQRKAHPNLNDHFVQLSSLAGNTPSSISGGPGSVNTHSDSNLRTSRILTEIRNVVANPHPHYDVYLSESNMSFWKVIIQGPPESAYSSGTFVVYLDMEQDYPAFPPKCRFTTQIYHPNINRHGKVCHSILDRNWTSDTTNLQLINTIYSLLLVPEFSDPINAVVTLNYHWDEVAFHDEVKAHIEKHATKGRAEWRSEILGLAA